MKRKSLKELQFQLLISETEKQVAQMKLTSALNNANSFASLRTEPKSHSHINNSDEVKRKAKVGNQLNELISIISNESLQTLLKISAPEQLSVLLDQGKTYKLLKRILKPFIQLLKSLINTPFQDSILMHQSKQSVSQVNSSKGGILSLQANVSSSTQSLLQTQHDKMKYLKKTEIITPQTNNSVQIFSQDETDKRLKTVPTIPKSTQTHDKPLYKRQSQQIEAVPRFKRPKMDDKNIITHNYFH